MKTLLFLLSTTLLLNAQCLQEPSEVAVGECYELEGENNLAQAAYERALLEDENNLQARLKLAELYQSLGMDTQASALLVNVNDSQLTPEQRTSLSTLRVNSKVDSTVQFRARVSVDLGYDNNININPIDNTVDTALSTPFIRTRADLSYLHTISDDDSWFARGDLSFYKQVNTSERNYDSTYFRLYGGGGYQGGNFSIYIPLFYEHLNYLDRDLIEQKGIHPDYNWQFNKDYILNINGSYSARRYIQVIERGRDDNLLMLESGVIWLHARDFAYAKLRYESYAATHDNTEFVNKKMIYLKLGGLYAIEEILDLRAEYQYFKANYDYVPLRDIERSDDNHNIALSAERDLMEHLRIHAQFRYIDSTSNYNPAKYNKQEMLVGLVYNY